MEQLLKKDSNKFLNIQNLIGQDMFISSASFKVNNGKLLVEGIEEKNRFSNDASKLIFIIDLESEKLLSIITDPAQNHVDLTFDMWDDSTLVVMHSLKNEEVYLINIYNHKTDKKHIQFDKSSNRPHTIDANGKQLFMTNNVYGFAVGDLYTLYGRVFSNSSFSTSQSTVSYPIDMNLNLLSGTFKYDSAFSENFRESITIYAFDEDNKVKWDKALPFIKYDDMDAFNFYNYCNHFIIKYHNTVECLDKQNGKLVWHFINEQPITQTFMVGNKLVIHSFSDFFKMVPSDDEKWNEKMKKDCQDLLKVIDLESGELLWRESFTGTYSHLGILGKKMILYNRKKSSILNLETMQEQPMKYTMDLNQASFVNIMDTKTGKLYLNYNETLYW